MRFSSGKHSFPGSFSENSTIMKQKITPVLIIGLLLLLAGLMSIPQTRTILLSPFSDQDFTTQNKKQNRTGTHVFPVTSAVEDRLVEKFTELELYEEDYSIRSGDSIVRIEASIPKGKPMEWIVWNLVNTVKGTSYSVEDCICRNSERCIIEFKSSDPRLPLIVLKTRRLNRYFSTTAKMAVLIEDFGFEADRTTVEYLSFSEPLTVSLVPSQRLSSWTATIADEYKKEVVILLPMEPIPSEYDKYRQSTVMIHFSEEKIRRQFERSIAAIPNFSGVCNFYGARAMEDSRIMEIILSKIKKSNGYFLYSQVSRKSVARSMAKRLKVPHLPVQGTIEADDPPEKIKEKLNKYAFAAQKTGRILVKSPPTSEFMDVLKMQLDNFRFNGIRLVYVSELISDYKE